MEGRFRRVVEYILIASSAAVSLVIGVLDLTGLLDASSWIAQRVPSLTLIAVGLVASYLVFERKVAQETLRAVTNSAERVIRSLDGVEVTVFGSGADCWTHMSERFRDARRIDDVTWWGLVPRPRSRTDKDTWQKYQDTISKVARQPTVVFREVASFRSMKDLVEREKERLLDEGSVGYNLGYYKARESDDPPHQGFVVIDGEEVVIGHTRGQVWLSVKHPDIARWFSAYFEDLWEGATKLKQGGVVEEKKLADLEQFLKKRDAQGPGAEGAQTKSPEGVPMPDGGVHE